MPLEGVFSRRGAARLVAAAFMVPACRAAPGAGVIEVESFRAARQSDRDTVQAALDVWLRDGGTLLFDQHRRYDFGDVVPGKPIFLVQNARDAIIDGAGCTLRCRTASTGKTQMFLFRNSRGVTIRNVNAMDDGADLTVDWRGMDFVHVDGSSGAQGPFLLEGVNVLKACSLFTCSGTKGGERVSGITIRDCTADRVYYGINLQENGDGLIADLRAHNCRRVYFPYGVSRQRVTLDIAHDGRGPGANACIMIARYQRNTRDIAVKARFTGALPWAALARLELKEPFVPGGVIEDVAIELFIADDAYSTSAPVAFAFSAAGSRRFAAVPEAWRNIRLSGRLGPLGRDPVRVEAISTVASGATFTDLDRGITRAITLR